MKVTKLFFFTVFMILMPSLAQGMASAVFNFLTANRYAVASTQLSCPNQYSINLMWVNKTQSANSTYIFPSTNKKNNSGKQFFDTIFRWASKNPDASINLWFDSALTTPDAIETTQEYINQETEKNNLAKKIELRDVRRLERVKQNPAVFTSTIPVYFRADLLRAIVAEELLRQNNESNFVYTDFDVEPLSKSQLFDQKTLNQLNKHHYVMAKETNKLGFENSLQIFTYHQPLLKALKLMVIDANILRAQSFLDNIKEKNDSASPLSNPSVWKFHEVSFQENVFYSYPLMHVYLNQLQSIGSPLILPGSSEPFNKKNHGKKILNDTAKIIMAKSSALKHLVDFPIPTKQVSIPVSASAYNELINKRENS